MTENEILYLQARDAYHAADRRLSLAHTEILNNREYSEARQRLYERCLGEYWEADKALGEARKAL